MDVNTSKSTNHFPWFINIDCVALFRGLNMEEAWKSKVLEETEIYMLSKEKSLSKKELQT